MSNLSYKFKPLFGGGANNGALRIRRNVVCGRRYAAQCGGRRCALSTDHLRH